jgi:hypothetical protein
MDRFRIFLSIVICTAATTSRAQQVTGGVPFQSFGAGYSQSTGINWSLGGPNWFANTNNQVVPPFGPSLANTGTSGGFGFGGNGFSGGLSFNFAQGSNRSIVSAAPSMTTTSGYPGSFFSGEVRPFVTGLTPIVGSYLDTQNAMSQLATADQQGKLSSIAQANADRQNEKLRSYLRRAERAESEGDMKMARANYRLALPLADPELRAMIQKTLSDRFSGKSRSIMLKAGK